MAGTPSLSRFQGCLLGVLVGDCLGAPFEGNRVVARSHLNRYFNQMLDPKVRLPFKAFTDDTAMTKSVALSLINCKEFNAVDMAKRFVAEYIAEPKRGYGSTVGEVFQNLRLSDFEDPYGPAKRQFGGLGSYGNGAAMRVAPIGLLYCEDKQSLFDVARNASMITHSNELGIRGALLQALAVQRALKLSSGGEAVDVLGFADAMIEDMKKVEEKDTYESKQKMLPASSGGSLTKDPETSYVKKLEIVKAFLQKPEPPPREEIDELLGVYVSAHRSVPTALYCFLAAQKDIPEIETSNSFQRTLQFAYSLGGDTDTIGSMAAALAGAQVGIEGVPSQLLKHCEGIVSEVLKWAEDLFSLANSAPAAREKKVG